MGKIIIKNKIIQKFISCLIIFSMLTPAIFISLEPKKAEAQWVVVDPAHIALTAKTIGAEILKQALMRAAKKLLAQMTQSTINWINTGYYGNPLFVENPKSFFKDIAKYEVRNIINAYGYDPLRFPFGKDFALNTIAAYQRQTRDNAQYTLSQVIDDPVLLDNYRNDFNVGGWNGFLINTQYPQNNYLGFQMLASEELGRQLNGITQNNAQKVNTALQQGQGFLSPQTCPSNPAYNTAKNQFQQPSFKSELPAYADPSPEAGDYQDSTNSEYPTATPEYMEKVEAAQRAYNEKLATERHIWDQRNACPGGLVSTTPGSIVGSQIAGALASKLHSTELSQAIGGSLAAIFDTLLEKFTDKGLNALSNKINPPPEPVIDENDFIYLGESLNSLNTKYPETPVDTSVPDDTTFPFVDNPDNTVNP